jgi:hypothetical protein
MKHHYKASKARQIPLLAASVIAIAAISPGMTKADWISSSLDQRCHPDDIAGVTDNVREAIEASVRRAEASIMAPAGVADLGCLNDLMSAPIDIFSNVGSVMGALQGGVFDSLPFDMDMDVSGMVCDFAAEKWGDLTQGLGSINTSISQFANTPSSLIQRLAGGGGFGSGSGNTTSTGNLNFGLPTTGSVSYTSNPTGTQPVEIAVETPPDTTPPVVYNDGAGFNELAWNQALATYEAEVQSLNLEYASCLTARAVAAALYGQGGTDRNGNPIICTAPALPYQPQPEDFRTAEATFTPLMRSSTSTSSGTTAQPQPVSPSSLIGESEPTVVPRSSTSPSTEQSIQSIWDRF